MTDIKKPNKVKLKTVKRHELLDTLKNLCKDKNLVGYYFSGGDVFLNMYNSEVDVCAYNIHVNAVKNGYIDMSDELVKEIEAYLKPLAHKNCEIIIDKIIANAPNSKGKFKNEMMKHLARFNFIELERYIDLTNNGDSNLRSVDDCILAVRLPSFYKANDNTNGLFDFIEVEISLTDRGAERKEFIDFVRTHNKDFYKRALQKIASLKKWKDYNIPISRLKCSEGRLTPDNFLSYTLELKDK